MSKLFHTYATVNVLANLVTGSTNAFTALPAGGRKRMMRVVGYVGDGSNPLSGVESSIYMRVETTAGIEVAAGGSFVEAGRTTGVAVYCSEFIAEAGTDYRIYMDSDNAGDTEVRINLGVVDASPTTPVQVASAPAPPRGAYTAGTLAIQYGGLRTVYARIIGDDTADDVVMAATSGSGTVAGDVEAPIATYSGLNAGNYLVQFFETDSLATQGQLGDDLIATSILNWDGSAWQSSLVTLQALQTSTTQLDNAIDSIETVADAGGVRLNARFNRINYYNSDYVDVIQGEAKTLSILIEPETGLMSTATPTTVTVVISDTDGETVTIANGDITRSVQLQDLQVYKVPLTVEQTAGMAPGIATIQISMDSDRALIKQALRIVEDL